MKDLMSLVNECFQELDSLQVPYAKNISFKVNTRAKHRWGKCKIEPNGHYTIEVSYRLLEDNVPDKSVKTTIIHEILHTVPDGNKHTGGWRLWANTVNSRLGYNIQRCTSSEEKGVAPIEITKRAKYAVHCSKCGNTWYRTRATRVTSHPENYHCPCGGSLSVETL